MATTSIFTATRRLSAGSKAAVVYQSQQRRRGDFERVIQQAYDFHSTESAAVGELDSEA